MDRDYRPPGAPFDPYRWFGTVPRTSRIALLDPATARRPDADWKKAYGWLQEDAKWQEGMRHLRKAGHRLTITVLRGRHVGPGDLIDLSYYLGRCNIVGYEAIGLLPGDHERNLRAMREQGRIPGGDAKNKSYLNALIKNVVESGVPSFCYDISGDDKNVLHAALFKPHAVFRRGQHTPETRQMSRRQLKAMHFGFLGVREVFWPGSIGKQLKDHGVKKGEVAIVVGAAHDRVPMLLAQAGAKVRSAKLTSRHPSLVDGSIGRILQAGSLSLRELDNAFPDWKPQ